MSGIQERFSRWFEYNAIPWFTSLGLSKRTITLEVIGRKSGRPRKVTVSTVADERSRYLVSVHGESHWVRNVRAAEGRAMILSGGRKPVRLVELPVHERAHILLRYVSQGSFGRSAEEIARQFGVGPNPTLDQMTALADRHPVFRIEWAS